MINFVNYSEAIVLSYFSSFVVPLKSFPAWTQTLNQQKSQLIKLQDKAA